MTIPPTGVLHDTFTVHVKLARHLYILHSPQANTYTKSQLRNTHTHLSAHLKSPLSCTITNIQCTRPFKVTHTQAHSHAHTWNRHVHQCAHTPATYWPLLSLESYARPARFFCRFRVKRNLVPPPLSSLTHGSRWERCAYQRKPAPCLHTSPPINTWNTTFPGPLGLGIS